ncbi:type II secretion system protein GspE [Maricaulis sp. W15]|uniref:type II secretion system ATPase GspE n=1 Tax=Maricaulis sp. W15 TaxID=1772333 RepID=UPI000948C6D5|nr:type II secretion system ATPase GspE [Maricaulis sp. W15]OLF71067.1 type II secretion system protein GspE [Maricaulis sp. W15]
MTETADTATDRSPVTYSFARQKGVAFQPESPSGEAAAFLLRSGADRRALLELRRVVGRTCPVRELAAEVYDRTLSDLYAYSGLGSDAIDSAEEGDDSLTRLIDEMPRTEDLLDSDSDAPIIRLINGMIAEAVRTAASDVHVEPFEDRVSIRYRVDGVMHETASVPPRLAPPLVSRIKVMARLDIAEKRIPQDGRLSITLGGQSVDVRVSTLPSRHGERVVLRLLDNSAARFRLEDLGMPAAMLVDLRKALAQPNGIILVTGPTGAGKTTTLYAGLNLLNEETRNILTVEDPVEYAIDGIGQTQVNAKVGMTFAAGLRAILRQDPDIVMVGEIRDVETARIAVQASLTGHLVLSTVHTNSAIAAIARLRDMGVESYLLASTLTAIVAQRLVRRLCGHCREAYTPDAAELELLGLTGRTDVTLHKPAGCSRCKQTGYDGRTGLYELVMVDDALRKHIHDDAREAEMAAHAFAKRPTLFRNGVELALAGTTSLAEVLRVCREEGERHAGV